MFEKWYGKPYKPQKARERIVIHTTPRTLILALQKRQTYKQYPIDLFHREHIEAMTQLDGQYHQLMDGKEKWLNYTL